MFEYRFFTLRIDQSIMGSKVMSFADDAEALAYGRRMINNHDIEVWQGTRIMQRLDHKSSALATTSPRRRATSLA